MAERKIDWKISVLPAIAIFGAGVSVGRFVPAAQPPESLAQKLTHLCSNNEYIQPSTICQTVFATKFEDEDWTEVALVGLPQESLDAEFIDFISAVVSPNNDGLQGEAACRVVPTIRPETCAVLPALPERTRQTIQIQHDASKSSLDQRKQSWLYRTVAFLTTASTWVWRFVVFASAGTAVGAVLGARYFFWPWVCFPWIWFFKDASATYVLCWFGLTTFVAYDMDFMRYKVSRTLIFAGLIAVSLMTSVWFLVKGNREVAFSLFCFFAVAVPLDLVFDWIVTHVGMAAKNLME
ncbi:hypothetical protein B0H63DRAFT_14837 [Podospora didyma]|uniref:Uncharacterized protein n=1 Tax=Podospora didyma TaxID=330526 RepID=A0AAE0U717_9PEZI|nr:hypothetical protein B0H63DRAFT_14837 [Podospora didyma]